MLFLQISLWLLIVLFNDVVLVDVEGKLDINWENIADMILITRSWNWAASEVRG